MTMKYNCKTHEKHTAYEGFFRLSSYRVSFEKYTGGYIENVVRECSEKCDVVAVIPYDPIKKIILMVEQFRIGMMVRGEHAWTQEIVAGFMDVEGEDALTTAKRELLEETGCQAKSIEPLISYYPGPGGSAAKVHVFYAIVDSDKSLKYTGVSEEGEDICVQKVALSTIKERLQKGEVDNSTSIIAFQQFFMRGIPNQ